MLTLEKIASGFFKTNTPLQTTLQREVKIQQSEVCWLCKASFAECEEPFSQDTEGASREVRDHDHLTEHYRGAAHSKCNINVKQKQSSFVPIFSQRFGV